MQDVIFEATWSNRIPALSTILFGQTLHIGHDPYSDIVMPDDFSPRATHHATFWLADGVCWVADPNNTGVVYTNGRTVANREPVNYGIPVYIGNPTHSARYLKIIIDTMQMTQAMPNPAWDAPTLERAIAGVLPPLPEAVPSAYLVYGWTTDESHRFNLASHITLVGRSPGNNLVLPEHLKFISGWHFQIDHINEQYFITDRQSTNGTRLNNTLIPSGEPTPIKDQDIISIHVEGKAAWFVFYNPQDNLDDSPPISNLRHISSPETIPTLWERIRRLFSS